MGINRWSRTPVLVLKPPFFVFQISRRKMTYTLNEIAVLVAEYNDSGLSMRKFSKTKGISEKALKKWVVGKLSTR